MKIGDEVYIHGYVDEIRNDVVIIRNDGGYFGTIPEEVLLTGIEYLADRKTEPQTELVNDSPILAKDLVDDEFNQYDEECMRCKHLKLKCEFIPTYCKFESRDEPKDEPQTESE